MAEKIKKAFSVIDRFVQSDYYICLMAILTFLGWVYKIWVPMLCVMLALAVLPLFISKNTKHLLSFLMLFTCIISDNRHELQDFKYLLIPFVLLLVVGFIFSLVYFKRDWSVLGIKKIKGFHFALILLIIPFALGGLGSPYENGLAVFLAFLLVAVIAFGYTFFVVTNAKEKSDLMDYMIKVLFVLGVVASFELITLFATSCNSIEELKSFILDKNSFKLGWAGANNVAPVISMAIPATFALCIKKNKATPIFVAIIALEYILILSTGCRGSILFSILALPIMLFYITIKTENKMAFCTSICVLFVVGIVLVGKYGRFISSILTSLLDRGFDSSSRVEWLYPEAIQTFKTWPIFGAGWDYRLGERVEGGPNDGYTPYWYHSTFFQVLANMGICGIIFFVIFYVWRYRLVLSLLNKPYALALTLSIALFDAYGMIDTNFFGPTFFIMLACISFTIEHSVPEKQCTAFGARPFKTLFAWLEKYRKTVEPMD